MARKDNYFVNICEKVSSEADSTKLQGISTDAIGSALADLKK